MEDTVRIKIIVVATANDINLVNIPLRQGHTKYLLLCHTIDNEDLIDLFHKDH